LVQRSSATSGARRSGVGASGGTPARAARCGVPSGDIGVCDDFTRELPVAESYNAYALQLEQRLRDDLVRAKADYATETLNKRIRNAETSKIPNMLVVGEREQASESVTLRRYGSREQVSIPFREFQDRLAKAIKARSATL
jgi:threonyl-tRNA synthetase